MTHRIPSELANKRFDQGVSELLGVSRNQLVRALEEGRITPAFEPSYKLRGGEEFTFLDLPTAITPSDQPLTVLYEDDSLLVIDKPAGLSVHPLSTRTEDTLVSRLLFRYPEITQAVHDPHDPVSILRPGIVHRLDRETSGVMVVAKTHTALVALSEQFRLRETHKEYVAIVCGELTGNREITTSLMRARAAEDNRFVAVEPGTPDSRDAHTSVIAEDFNVRGFTRVRCTIHTGRTHQIRVHLSSIGLPILGDDRYGSKVSQLLSKELGVTRLLLHAQKLSFQHPKTHEQVIFVSNPSDLSIE